MPLRDAKASGVCGRTASGGVDTLSSFPNLFRLLEVEAGKILLDGIDVSHRFHSSFFVFCVLFTFLFCKTQEPVLLCGHHSV